MHATNKKMQASTRRRTQINSNYIPSYSPTHGEFVNLCYVSVAPTVCVLHAFIYNAVNVNKIIIISSAKSPPYPYTQATTGLTLYLD